MEHQSTESYNTIMEGLKTMMWDDPQSIGKRLLNMVDLYRTYEMVFYLRRPERPSSSSKNYDLRRLIDCGIVWYQVMSIRSISCDDQKNVISLNRVISLLENNRETLTRENCLDYFSFPYDWKKEQERDHSMSAERFQKGIEEPEWGNGLNWVKSREVHKRFDSLSFTSEPSERTRDDVVDQRFFANLKNELKKCKDIEHYAHYNVAHIQNDDGRASLEKKIESKLPVIDEIYECFKPLWSVYNNININFMGQGLTCHLTKQFDEFEHLTEPWVSPEEERAYRETYKIKGQLMESDLALFYKKMSN